MFGSRKFPLDNHNNPEYRRAMKILKKDFDAAVSDTWNPYTCLIASAAKRAGVDMWDIIEASKKAGKAMNAFDENFYEPGDEKEPAMRKLRASLPITVKL